MLFNSCDNANGTGSNTESNSSDSTNYLFASSLVSSDSTITDCDTVYITQWKIKRVVVEKEVHDTVTQIVYTDSLLPILRSTIDERNELLAEVDDLKMQLAETIDAMYQPRRAMGTIDGFSLDIESYMTTTYISGNESFNLGFNVEKVKKGLFGNIFKPEYKVAPIRFPSYINLVRTGDNQFKLTRNVVGPLQNSSF